MTAPQGAVLLKADKEGAQMKTRFGTGGRREVIGDGFTRANIRRVACAMAAFAGLEMND